MHRRRALVAGFVLPLICPVWAQEKKDPGKRPSREAFAVITTSMGVIRARLFHKEAPRTVANFIGLATGKKPWRDEKTSQMRHTPFYDGLVFHRVIKGFMLQTGCPKGDGTGGPGFQFADEFHPTLKHDRAGILSMANSGPNTNGSQFYITVAPQAHLDNKHSVFGEVVEGLDVARRISEVPTTADRPNEEVKLISVAIESK